MFADLHHLHQFMSLDQGGNTSHIVSVVGGQSGTGPMDIYFGATHLSGTGTEIPWLQDDQVGWMWRDDGREEGMYNPYSKVQAFWADTTDMDNLRGAANGVAGGLESNLGNTVHTASTSTYAGSIGDGY